MQCAKCFSHPTLRKMAKKVEFTKTICNGCGIQLAGSENLKCESCNNYFVCNNCVICKSGHFMSKVFKLEKLGTYGYYSNNFSCDACHKSSIPSLNGAWHCKTCKYDLCDNCGPKF